MLCVHKEGARAGRLIHRRADGLVDNACLLAEHQSSCNMQRMAQLRDPSRS